MDIWWQGYSGLRLISTKLKIRTLAKLEDPPRFLLLHVGGNDLGVIKLKTIMSEASSLLNYIHRRLPHTRVIWSQILPRTSWRASQNIKAMNDSRIRLNSHIAKLVLSHYAGYYIKYSTLVENLDYVLCEDGVHLNEIGNQIFLNYLQAGLEFFLQSQGNVFPE